MNLLSKLFGEDGDKALEQLKNVARGVKDEVDKTVNKIEQGMAAQNQQQPPQNQPIAQHTGQVVPSGQPQPVSAPSGVSWGETMPAEENQFSSGLRFDDYFIGVFTQAFPNYRIEYIAAPYSRPGIIFTFWDGDREALVVEVISERSSADKLRRNCRAQGIPYLRYYHDHDGWWNTRSYVVDRTRAALEGRL